ncbi:MAG TPA: hypothetical protein VFJ14_16705 [Nocardioidaceae bacterium]|nr:hypothetical protein [Nocardioidaceae bacterium]
MNDHRAALTGLLAGVGLVVLAFVAEPLFSFDAHVFFAPLHAHWMPRVGPATVPVLVLAAAVVVWTPRLAATLPWRRLLAGVYVAGLAWILLLALVDGVGGIADPPLHEYEYLRTARMIDDVPAMLQEFVSRIPYSAEPRNWPSHIAGHPPGAFLFFIALARIGLDSGLAVGLVLCVLGATTPVLVLATMRTLGAEAAARAAAPFLTVGPVAIWVGVSADGGLFAPAVAAGLLVLAVAARRGSTGVAVAAGLVLGCTVYLSYGFVLVGVLALAVLLVAGSWRPLLPAVLAALVPTAVFLAFGYSWFEAYPVLRERYFDGWGGRRPYGYWVWANLAVLLLSAGLALAAATGVLVRRLGRLVRAGRRALAGAERTPVIMGSAALLVVAAATLSGMSKAEVERIWVPFVPWALLLTALLPSRWRRPALLLQVLGAVLLQHLFSSYW